MAKFDYGDDVAREAQLGHLAPLIGYVAAGLPLTPAHREFIAEALARLAGPRDKAEVRKAEKLLIRLHLDNLINEDWKAEAAVHEVMRIRGRSRSTVYGTRKKSKTPI